MHSSMPSSGVSGPAAAVLPAIRTAAGMPGAGPAPLLPCSDGALLPEAMALMSRLPDLEGKEEAAAEEAAFEGDAAEEAAAARCMARPAESCRTVMRSGEAAAWGRAAASLRPPLLPANPSLPV